MKVILTGATGFIGKHLWSFLLKHDFEVISIVRDRESELCRDNRCLTYEEFYQLGESELPGVDAVIHLAGAAHKNFSDQDAKETNETLTKNMVSKSKYLGVKRFIFISSLGIYHEQSEMIDLDTVPSNTKKNTNLYKLKAENIVKSAFLDCSTDYVIIRLPLVYGEGVKANFASLMNLVSKGIPVPFGRIDANRRSLVSVANLVDLIMTCIDHPKAANQVFLVSDDNDVSTAEMVKQISNALAKPNRVLSVPLWCYKLSAKLFGKEEVINRLLGSLQVDITHTKETLNWTPPQTLETGFKETAEAFLQSKQK